MSQITIEWTHKVAGREAGQTETVEDGLFVRGAIAGGHAVQISGPEASEPAVSPITLPDPVPAAIVGVFEDPASVMAEVAVLSLEANEMPES